jgi:hypothetical protein
VATPRLARQGWVEVGKQLWRHQVRRNHSFGDKGANDELGTFAESRESFDLSKDNEKWSARPSSCNDAALRVSSHQSLPTSPKGADARRMNERALTFAS